MECFIFHYISFVQYLKGSFSIVLSTVEDRARLSFFSLTISWRPDNLCCVCQRFFKLFPSRRFQTSSGGVLIVAVLLLRVYCLQRGSRSHNITQLARSSAERVCSFYVRASVEPALAVRTSGDLRCYCCCIVNIRKEIELLAERKKRNNSNVIECHTWRLGGDDPRTECICVVNKSIVYYLKIGVVCILVVVFFLAKLGKDIKRKLINFK